MPSGGHNKIWTDDRIESEIRPMAESLGHFPTNSELVGMKRGDLANAIGKRGGYVAWAERLGIPRIESDSDFGWKGEIAFAELCRAQGLTAERTVGVKSPWDVTIQGVLRADVKTATLHTYQHSTGWFYRIGKKPQADVVILYQDDTKNFYGLPWWLCPTTNITITMTGGKYAAYLNNWPLLREMLLVRKVEKEKLSEVA